MFAFTSALVASNKEKDTSPDMEGGAGLPEVELERSLKGEEQHHPPRFNTAPNPTFFYSLFFVLNAFLFSCCMARPLTAASGVGDKAATADTVPVIDLSNPAPDAISQALWAAATTVGFFTVINHGIPLDQIDDAFSCSESFFAQPLEAGSALRTSKLVTWTILAVTWTILAVIDWFLPPYSLLGSALHSLGGITRLVTWTILALSSIGCVLTHNK